MVKKAGIFLTMFFFCLICVSCEDETSYEMFYRPKPPSKRAMKNLMKQKAKYRALCDKMQKEVDEKRKEITDDDEWEKYRVAFNKRLGEFNDAIPEGGGMRAIRHCVIFGTEKRWDLENLQKYMPEK